MSAGGFLIAWRRKGGMDVAEGKPDWAAVEADYLGGGMTVRDIARKHGVSESTLYKKATSKGWKNKKDKIRQKTDEIVIARNARARARELGTMQSASMRMARLLDRTVAALEDQPAEAVITQLKGLGSLASAIKTNVDALMLLNGIQTPAQVEAQHIARQRLALEQRRQQMEEQREQQGQEEQKVEVTIRMEEPDEDEQVERIRRLCLDHEAES